MKSNRYPIPLKTMTHQGSGNLFWCNRSLTIGGYPTHNNRNRFRRSLRKNGRDNCVSYLFMWKRGQCAHPLKNPIYIYIYIYVCVCVCVRVILGVGYSLYSSGNTYIVHRTCQKFQFYVKSQKCGLSYTLLRAMLLCDGRAIISWDPLPPDYT